MQGVQHRLALALVALALAASPAAMADNAMGYDVLSAQQAASLPRGGGSLGLDLGRGQVINDAGMTFELLQVRSVRRDSPAARAGLTIGDQIIAVDGHVFQSLAAFAGYVGSMPPGQSISVDYMPPGGGPGQAQRVAITLAGSGTTPTPQPAPSHGLSTGEKVAIGTATVALFGCYELGCFKRKQAPVGTPVNTP